MSKVIQIDSLEGWRDLSRRILSALASFPQKEAVVLALCGDLGVGKTTFTQYLGKELGVEGQINSPTFNIMKIYRLGEEAREFTNLVHLDVYRFDHEEELKPLRFADYLKEKENLVVVEWADKIKNSLPPTTLFLDFVTLNENERQVTISGPGQLVESI